MRLIALVGAFFCAVLLAGCQDRPAHIVNPTDASRAALQKAVSAALHGASVTLADDALTNSSVLTIEPKAIRDTQGNRVMGRDLGTPIQFRLIKHGVQCFLVLQSSGTKWPLPDTTCKDE
jgi:hypothetical protein